MSFFSFLFSLTVTVFSLYFFFIAPLMKLSVSMSLSLSATSTLTPKNGRMALMLQLFLSFFLHSETCLTSVFIKKSLTCHKGLGDFDKVGWTHTVLWHEKYLHTPRVLYVALWCTQHLGIRSKSLPPNWLYSRNARIQGHK